MRMKRICKSWINYCGWGRQIDELATSVKREADMKQQLGLRLGLLILGTVLVVAITAITWGVLPAVLRSWLSLGGAQRSQHDCRTETYGTCKAEWTCKELGSNVSWLRLRRNQGTRALLAQQGADSLGRARPGSRDLLVGFSLGKHGRERSLVRTPSAAAGGTTSNPPTLQSLSWPSDSVRPLWDGDNIKPESLEFELLPDGSLRTLGTGTLWAGNSSQAAPRHI
eukprot:jgi/Botrbrau1/9743/Bobra.0388s0031.2